MQDSSSSFVTLLWPLSLFWKKKPKQTPTASFPVVVTNAFMAEPQINNAGIPN